MACNQLPGPSKRKQGKPINSREQAITLNVLDYFEKERENMNRPRYRSNAVLKKTAAATGIHINSVRKIEKNKIPVPTPGKRRPSGRKKFGKLDEFDLGVIRRIIHQFYIRNEIPTLNKLLKELRSKMDFPYKRTCLHELLQKMGFKFKRRGRERIIYERDDLVVWREKYLRKIMEIRKVKSSSQIVYLDETWLNEGHRVSKEWVDLTTLKKAGNLRALKFEGLSVGCTKDPIGKGKRIIITDAMTEDGPIEGALWIFNAESKKRKSKLKQGNKTTKNKKPRKNEKSAAEGEITKQIDAEKGADDSDQEETGDGLRFQQDYHDCMNSQSFEAYFTSLCKIIPKNSVIVLDNASYHTRNSDSHPTSKWRKQQLIDWLRSKNIPVSPDALRSELWILAKTEREKYPSKVIESIASEAGHSVIRLPPYHCELNPIELAWSAEKNYVAHENTDMTLELVERLFREKRNDLPKTFWKNCVEHVKSLEKNYIESDKIQDIQTEKLIIELGNSSDSDSESSLTDTDHSSDSELEYDLDCL